MTHPGDGGSGKPWVRRTAHVLRPDPDRVLARLFLPGQEMVTSGESRSAAVIARVLALADDEVERELLDLTTDFGHRHHDLEATWDQHFGLVRHRLPHAERLPAHRRRLVGAYFTQEYAVESTALFNPSMVAHPDQDGLPSGSTRFVMTVRAVGEGHVSSLELRTGTVDAAGAIELDAPPAHARVPVVTEPRFARAAFEHQLDEDPDGDRANADFVLDALGLEFGRAELDLAYGELRSQRLTRGSALRTIERFERIARRSYEVTFPPDSALRERILMPQGATESHGVEDVRMVRFEASDGPPTYLGTYTAYDGRDIAMQLLSTHDFAHLTSRPLSGPGARNKGLALFPRQIGGRYVALSRADRETNAITTSDDLLWWGPPAVVQRPERAWELVQLGNCGPPVETERGWLVLTHGVGPMRTYSIGALLLDLDDPTQVVGRLEHPLLTGTGQERSGYVPNVVYSCGAMRHGRSLVVPYGSSDTATRFAIVDLDPLLDTLCRRAAAVTRQDHARVAGGAS
ncbi:glycoside hydrolase family 130 protein [Cellulomonas composti]|uniref:Glycosidase n=1 Tax=Cellulomonas composti TaxID=266130 RepID=A0A511J8S4_9CELL|nr:glycoside hydrolase family 130 protein [Cellulomonas composti]GEL94397.1 glycosidase [Cellulomonas composti]